MITSFSTGGRPRSSNTGIVVVIVRSTMPTRPCCRNAFTRKRPMPGGAIAKLHSFVDSNCAACLSFMTLRTSSIVCCGVSAVFETGWTLPSILSAGGKPAVMNRSEDFCWTMSSSSSWMNLVARSRSMRSPGAMPCSDAAGSGEEVLVDGAHARFL